MKISLRRVAGLAVAASVAMLSISAGGTVAQAADPKIVLTVMDMDKDILQTETSIAMTLTVANTGDAKLTNIDVKLADDAIIGGTKPDVKCVGDTLDIERELKCTTTYTYVRADDDRGYTYLSFEATGTAGAETVTYPYGYLVLTGAGATVTIESDSTGLVNPAGDTVKYTFTVKNAFQDIALKDAQIWIEGEPKDQVTDCGVSVPAGGSSTCTATRTYTAADIATWDDGKTTIKAYIGAFFVADKLPASITSKNWIIGPAKYPLEAPTKPAVKFLTESVDKESAKPGDTLTYTFTVQNSGSEELKNLALKTVSFTGDKATAPDPAKATCTQGGKAVTLADVKLAFKEKVTCTLTYKVVAADATAATVSLQISVTAKATQLEVNANSKALSTKITKAALTAPTGGSMAAPPMAGALGGLALLAGLGMMIAVRRYRLV